MICRPDILDLFTFYALLQLFWKQGFGTQIPLQSDMLAIGFLFGNKEEIGCFG